MNIGHRSLIPELWAIWLRRNLTVWPQTCIFLPLCFSYQKWLTSVTSLGARLVPKQIKKVVPELEGNVSLTPYKQLRCFREAKSRSREGEVTEWDWGGTGCLEYTGKRFAWAQLDTFPSLGKISHFCSVHYPLNGEWHLWWICWTQGFSPISTARASKKVCGWKCLLNRLTAWFSPRTQSLVEGKEPI